jgi:hypothetical protein
VSVRTVWYDIQAGRLSVIRSDRRVHVPRSALTGYRPTVCEHLLTVRQVANLLHVSIKSVHRRIRNGTYVVVRFSPRCVRIDAQRTIVDLPLRSRAGQTWEPSQTAVMTLRALGSQPGRLSLAAIQAARPDCVSPAAPVNAVHLQTLIWNLDMSLIDVPLLAQLTGISTRSLYHDVKKRALPAIRIGRSLLRVQLRDAIAYADDARPAIIRWMVKRAFPAADIAEQVEISRRFAAWLVAHLPDHRSAR